MCTGMCIGNVYRHVHRHVYRHVYTPASLRLRKPISVSELMAMADMLQLEQLTRYCEKWLVGQLNKHNVFMVWELADETNAEDLQLSCAVEAMRNLDQQEVYSHPRFQSYSAQICTALRETLGIVDDVDPLLSFYLADG